MLASAGAYKLYGYFSVLQPEQRVGSYPAAQCGVLQAEAGCEGVAGWSAGGGRLDLECWDMLVDHVKIQGRGRVSVQVWKFDRFEVPDGETRCDGFDRYGKKRLACRFDPEEPQKVWMLWEFDASGVANVFWDCWRFGCTRRWSVWICLYKSVAACKV
jgi:hypothetical protein